MYITQKKNRTCCRVNDKAGQIDISIISSVLKRGCKFVAASENYQIDFLTVRKEAGESATAVPDVIKRLLIQLRRCQ